MVLLALIHEQQRLSLGSFGIPRMTLELNEAGLRVGERGIAPCTVDAFFERWWRDFGLGVKL
jgi:hypothetical protein